MVSAAGIHMDKTICQTASADGFHDKSACNTIAFSDHTRDDCMLTPLREYGEHYLLADRMDTHGQ